ncbi:hypothetical protein BP6252_11405 [Coleophoma cylindrospora]|uniref:Aminoglycoside phosphotransferase domain-containing protein n=1 Tax=Coleophoma cylindrospora TaxID=1849047 RepID=A0A3D8QJI0_9HELO|nr:hypothetical protein BP6252_11405 [Coleophoma cylindrospora]
MHSQQEIEEVASQLLSTKDLKLVACRTLQSLWAGYGHICEIKAVPSAAGDASQQPSSFILKYISPPATNRKGPPKEGHLRKILSYQIEQYFYTHLAPQMPPSIGVASCLASIDDKSGSNATAMIMTDLNQKYPVAGEKRGELNEAQVHAAVDWLATFHGFWWGKTQSFDRSKLCRPPLEHFQQTKSTTADEGVWLNGGYTYLATRRDEYRDLCASDSEWCAPLCSPLTDFEGQTIAELVARFLAPLADGGKEGPISKYETLIHGDVKSENLFTTARGDAVAFFDFQYVGLGLGVCDLAKLFTCSLPQELLSVDAFSSEDIMKMGEGEEKFLRRYLDKLRQVSGREYEWDVFVRHWEIGLVDWLRFQASWGFWGNTEWLEGRVRSIVNDPEWKAYLERESKA